MRMSWMEMRSEGNSLIVFSCSIEHWVWFDWLSFVYRSMFQISRCNLISCEWAKIQFIFWTQPNTIISVQWFAQMLMYDVLQTKQDESQRWDAFNWLPSNDSVYNIKSFADGIYGVVNHCDSQPAFALHFRGNQLSMSNSPVIYSKAWNVIPTENRFAIIQIRHHAMSLKNDCCQFICQYSQFPTIHEIVVVFFLVQNTRPLLHPGFQCGYCCSSSYFVVVQEKTLTSVCVPLHRVHWIAVVPYIALVILLR